MRRLLSRIGGFMQTIRGKPISPGYAAGQAFVYGAEVGEVPRYAIAPDDVEVEHGRFHDALMHAREELERLQDRVRAELGDSEAEIFSAHLAFLSDRRFVARVKDRMLSELTNAEHAVEIIVADVADSLRSVEHEYLREREQDVRDMGRRVLRHLTRQRRGRQGRGSLDRLAPQTVLVARELMPSDLFEMDRGKVVGIVTEQGGEAGHAAILARSLGIPAVTGVADATRRIANGARLLVDGRTGEIQVDPSPQSLRVFALDKQLYDEMNSTALAEESRACMTSDGVKVDLYANIGRVDEAEDVARHHLAGVGLLRTELMFLDALQPPGLEEQWHAYRRLSDALGARPVVIRTLDWRGDKRPAFLAGRIDDGAGPVARGGCAGVRGLRFALSAMPEVLYTQLRAIVRAGAERDVRVLFPMVLGADDLHDVIAMLGQVVADEGLNRTPRIGAMIETPSAVFTVDEILDQADFLSIGTNDLTQYMLAADRDALDSMDSYSVLHPAVLRAIRQVVRAADARGRPVCVCGEAAGDPNVASLLVGLGVRELSMSPRSAARVRQMVRHSSFQKLQQLAEEALRSYSLRRVRELVMQLPAG